MPSCLNADGWKFDRGLISPKKPTVVSFSFVVTLNTFNSSSSWFRVLTVYGLPFNTSLSSSSLLCLLYPGSLFAAHRTGNRVFLLRLVSMGYSRSTYTPFSRSNLFSRINSMSSWCVSSTEMGLIHLLLKHPNHLQFLISIRLAAMTFSSPVSPCIILESI